MFTINLLPNEQKEQIYSEKIIARINNFLMPPIFIIFVLIFICGYGIYYFRQTNKDLDNQIQQKNSEIAAFNETKNKIQIINANLANIKKLIDYQINWPAIYADFAKNVPNNLQVTSMNIDVLNKGKIEFSGVCDNITTALTLQKNLEQAEFFKNVNLISSKKTDKDTNFKMQAELDKIKLPAATSQPKQGEKNE